MQALAHLMLAGNNVTCWGVEQLCAGMTQNASLVSVALDDNDLGDNGVRAVLRWLESAVGVAAVGLQHSKCSVELQRAVSMLLEARRGPGQSNRLPAIASCTFR
jgi:hypothetical protein